MWDTWQRLMSTKPCQAPTLWQMFTRQSLVDMTLLVPGPLLNKLTSSFKTLFWVRTTTGWRVWIDGRLGRQLRTTFDNQLLQLRYFVRTMENLDIYIPWTTGEYWRQWPTTTDVDNAACKPTAACDVLEGCSYATSGSGILYRGRDGPFDTSLKTIEVCLAIKKGIQRSTDCRRRYMAPQDPLDERCEVTANRAAPALAY